VAEALAVFPSTHLTLRGEKLFAEAGVPGRAVMKPRRIASDCGLAIALPAAEIARARAALAAAGVEARFYLPEGDGWRDAGEGP
jgi:hypothetical protein